MLSGPTPHAVNVLLLWLIRTMKFSGFLPVFYRIFRILHFGKFSIEKTQRACKTFARPLSEGEFHLETTQRACKTFARPLSEKVLYSKKNKPDKACQSKSARTNGF